MEKEENQNNSPTNKSQEAENAENDIGENRNNLQPEDISSDEKEKIKESSPAEKITELEDKLARTFAEMENQRRRFEKEKEDAFEYGGFSFACLLYTSPSPRD